MELFRWLWFLALTSFATAQLENLDRNNGTQVLNAAINFLPSCALDCTTTVVGSSSCLLTDVACIKSNIQLQDDLSVCVKANCTIREALTAKGFLAKLLEAPVRDHTLYGTLTCLIIGGTCVIVYILRVIARLPIFGGNWGWDDWVMTAAIMFVIPLTVCSYVLNELGLGRDMWMVPLDNVTKILEIFFFTELLYLTSIGLTKISILLFYLRIFPQRSLKRAILITIGVSVVYIIGFVIATALQCIPIRVAWERWDDAPEHQGRCIDLNTHAWASAGFNMILDLVIIALPIRETWRLAMSKRRRFGVLLMFLGGGFVTFVSVLRLGYMVHFAHTQNVTWDYLSIGIWSAVETHVGVIVGCMPALRSLQTSIRNRYWPRAQSTNGYYENSQSGKSKTSRSGWTSRTSRIDRSGTLSRPHVGGKDDFLELGEYELKADASGKISRAGESATDFAKDMTQSFNSNEDIVPLTDTPAPTGHAIVVQKVFSVDRESVKSGHGYKNRA